MGYWDTKPASAANIRLFDPVLGWIAYNDVLDTDGRITTFGSHRKIELALSLALNASNLALLSGAGTSFCAANIGGTPTAPGMTDLWDAVVTAVGKPAFDTVLALIPKAPTIGKNIERLLTLCKIYEELFDNVDGKTVGAFIVAAEKAIAKRVNFVSETTNLGSHATMIRKIARRGIRKPRVRIFTTNYDLCFEYAAQAQRFTVIDGFSHSMPQLYDRGHFGHDIVRRDGAKESPDYVENVFHLYKLHGSLDWRRKGSDILRSLDDAIGTPLLIYPRDSKYQQAFEAPYLDMMASLQSALREPDTALIISGFGFNDDHISKPIMAAVEANMTLRVVICDVAFIPDAELSKGEHAVPAATSLPPYASASFKKFKQLAEIGDQRIVLLNGRFDDLSLAVPDLVAQTERERHAERIRVLHEPLTGGAP